MFDEKSINIHYKTPASRLLKMNTLNEFELNRIKKFYAQELASRRLERSKSSRLSSAAGRVRPQQQQQQHFLQLDGPELAFRVSSPAGGDGPSSSAAEAAAVDLERYRHALTAKRRFYRAGPGRSRRFAPKFGRAMFDFCAKNEGELSVRRGELVEILEIVAGNEWARVEDCQSGLQGLAPLSYLDYNIGCAVAKRDVASSTGGANSRSSSRTGGAESHLHASPQVVAGERQLLGMSKGEPIALIRRLDGHLYEASNTRSATGLVWSNDLEIIRQPVVDLRGPSGGRSASNYAAPLDEPADPCGEFTDDEDEPDDETDAEQVGDAEDEDEEMVRCLRSIRADLGAHRPRESDPNERRRRARSASGALNEQQQQHVQQQQQQQQYCTMSRRQRQRLAQQQAVREQEAQGRPLCNCALGCGATQRAPARSSSSPQIGPLVQQREGQTDNLPRLCRARFAYKPRQRDELELLVGDILVVVQECDDGWLIGTSYASKQMGTFPGNFVEPI